MTQRYTSARALERMQHGGCPECGAPPVQHDGRGGPDGCTLTDAGVADRIGQYHRDDRAREAAVHEHENLFSQWQASGLGIWEWIVANRGLIDQTARTRP